MTTEVNPTEAALDSSKPKLTSGSEYTLNSAFDTPEEAERLDRVHAAFQRFFGGNISLAPLDPLRTDKILELGCGSGAWALTAAKLFPQAMIFAIDKSPLPKSVSESISPNILFIQADLETKLSIEEEHAASFDIIHARFLLTHIVDVKGLLARVSHLLKPGGWLLLEDGDEEDRDQYGTMRGIVGKAPLAATFHRIMRARGFDPCVGRSHVDLLQKCGIFEEIHSRKLVIPLHPVKDLDPQMKELSEAWIESYRSFSLSLFPRFSKEGVTEELINDYLKGNFDPASNFHSLFHLTWAKKEQR